jgi:hypothetical protein
MDNLIPIIRFTIESNHIDLSIPEEKKKRRKNEPQLLLSTSEEPVEEMEFIRMYV